MMMFIFIYVFSHLVDAFIQSDFYCKKKNV